MNDNSIESVYENIKGHTLKLKMKKYGNVTEVTIRNQVKYSFYSKCLLLLLILLVNVFAFAISIVTVNYFLILLVVTSFFAFKIFSTIQYESILFVPKLGCQINKRYAMGHSTKFIPQHIIGGILINEVLSMQRVLFVLNILIKEHNKPTRLIPLFTVTLSHFIKLQIITYNKDHFVGY